MAKRFDWKTLSFKAETPSAKFSSPAVYGPYPNQWFDGQPISTMDEHIRFMFSGGSKVSKTEALSIPAVLRGRNLICNIANSPLITKRRDNEIVAREFLRQIDPNLPNEKVLSDTLEDLLLNAKAYWYVDVFDSRDYPLRAHHVPFENIHQDTQGNYWIDGKRVDNNRIIDFHSTNPALLETIAASVQRAKALSAAALMYANKPVPKVIVSPKGDADPEPEQIDDAMAGLANAAAESPFVYASAGMDVTALNMLSPTDLQLVESMKMVSIDIANALGLDPEDLGISTTSRDYLNGEARSKDKVNNLYNAYMKAITSRLSMEDCTPRGYFVKFDLDDYLKADAKTRMEVYTGYLAAGVMTVNEVRAKEGLAPLEEAVQPQESFSTEAEFNLAFDGATFAATDQTSRTVVGLAVPWGQAAKSRGRNFRFERGSLQYADVSRVKLLRDHDATQSVGYATDIKETDTGLEVTFKVAQGEAGDRALADFISKSHDGLSIGVDFSEEDTYTDPNHPGVTFVKKARLKEVSQVAIPSFDDSRVLSATYSRTGETMDNENPGVAVESAPQKTYTLEEIQALQAAFSNGSPVKTVKPASVDEDPNVEPAKKKDTKAAEATFVSEPVPYRFDGSTSEYEFSTDVINLQRTGDANARKRVMDFLSAEFAVTTTNAASLNPTIQRPDMYVDQLDYTTPIWNTIAKGTPPNGVNPFAFPKYSSSADLVADHVEGTEPDLGSFAVTNQTVTPSALSGKIEINREAWDMGGNPSLSNLIRNEMNRAYREGLENAAATFLDGLTLTGLEVTLTPAETDSDLEGEILDALIALQGQRGGYRLTDFLVHADLYKALVKAKDSTGRRLFPAVGPSNATGTVGRNFSSVDINGLLARYAWALGASGAVSENSYLLAPEDVHGWATAPQNLTFDIQVKSVYLAVWGYKAFAVSRNEGIRRFKYDPTA